MISIHKIETNQVIILNFNNYVHEQNIIGHKENIKFFDNLLMVSKTFGSYL